MILAADCTTTASCTPHTPFWGGTTTTSYSILLTVHILAIIAAFGPTFLFSLLGREARRCTGDDARSIALLPVWVNKRMTFPALIVAAAAGICLALDSSSQYSMSKPWISAAFAIVIVMALLLWFVLVPAQQRMADAVAKAGDDRESELRAARTSAGMATGFYHLGLVVLVVLMIWKPGQ